MSCRVLLLVIFVTYVAQVSAQRNDFATINFQRADSVAAAYADHSLLDRELLSEKLTRDLNTDVEKFRVIYTWVSQNIRYDYATYQKNQVQRKKLKGQEELKAWNQKIRVTVFKNLIHHKKTVCTGYAYLVKELSDYAGLECEIIDGYGRNVVSNLRGPAIANHQWNTVRLNGKWYLADATWSSGSYNLTEHAFNKHYDDGYFLAEPAVFVRNHYPLDTAWLLLPRKLTLDDFIRRPLVYRGIYRYGVQEIVPGTFDFVTSPDTSISFGFTGSSSVKIEKATLEIEHGSKKEIVPISVARKEDGMYYVDYKFKSRGRRAVHILANDDHLISFSVDVR
ncbi:MAG TPA: transglutaminase domain-containing protein [Ohtaekwangia sp.]|nr:transglutaminase domain-containing protein [Ohtaekwangia sp.]